MPFRIGNRRTTQTRSTKQDPESINWWHKYSVLSDLNAARVPFIKNGIYAGIENLPVTVDKTRLDGIKILDVGCGGGILCEALARLGADITGLDIDAAVIETAKEHQALDKSIEHNLKYFNTPIEEHEKQNHEKYDVVVISEVIEHIPNEQKERFLISCVKTLKPGGSLFTTCPSKTIFSRIIIIYIAELFNIGPHGLHDYNDFISHQDLTNMIQKRKCAIKTVKGIFYNPFKRKFVISRNKSIFYAIHALKMK